jgi:hypothetical protein
MWNRKISYDYNIISLIYKLHYTMNPPPASSNCTNYIDKGFQLFNLTRLREDDCYLDTRVRQSEGPGRYFTTNFHDCQCEAPHAKSVSLEQPVVQFRDGHGWTSMNGCNIDLDSQLRNAKNQTNPRLIQQLYTRPYVTVPYMGRGVGNICEESYLRAGESTFQGRACNNLSDMHIEHQYTPQLPCLRENIQNPQHLIPEDTDPAWVRGGQGSRQVIRNIDYLESAGYVYDGKMWKKKE